MRMSIRGFDGQRATSCWRIGICVLATIADEWTNEWMNEWRLRERERRAKARASGKRTFSFFVSLSFFLYSPAAALSAQSAWWEQAPEVTCFHRLFAPAAAAAASMMPPETRNLCLFADWTWLSAAFLFKFLLLSLSQSTNDCCLCVCAFFCWVKVDVWSARGGKHTQTSST